MDLGTDARIIVSDPAESVDDYTYHTTNLAHGQQGPLWTNLPAGMHENVNEIPSGCHSVRVEQRHGH